MPPIDVHAIESAEFSPSGSDGYCATSLAPAMYIGWGGPGMFETTRLNHGPRLARRAAAASRPPGAYAPSPMIASALIAIIESFR